MVNVARGGLVVDADLIALLDSGHLAGATLDVFRTSRCPPTIRSGIIRASTVTPHVSAATLIAESVAQIAAKIRRLESGEPVSGGIDRQRGY